MESPHGFIAVHWDHEPFRIPLTRPSAAPVAQTCSLLYRRFLTSCVRQKICFERATALSLPLLLKKGGEGRGEEALLINFPSLRLSPRSFLAGRERQNAASVLRAEHNWFLTCQPLLASHVPPITNRRYSRLQICATPNTYSGYGPGIGSSKAGLCRC